jgi:preprotein translocase subunit YajC
MSQSTMSILLIVLMIGLLYFMMIRPQQKRMRQQMELMNSMRAGDDVMTSAGIYGSVSEVEEDTVLLEVSEDVHIRVAKNSVTRIFTVHEETEEDEEPEEAEEQAEEPAEAEETAVAEEPQNSGESSKDKKEKDKKQ